MIHPTVQIPANRYITTHIALTRTRAARRSPRHPIALRWLRLDLVPEDPAHL